MRTQILLSTLLGLSVVPALTVPALAQEKGTIEIGAFAKFTAYDKSFGTTRKRQNSWGGGGRLGYFFSKHWELEADGSVNATDVKEFFDGYVSTALTYYPFHLRLNFNQRLGDNSPFTWILGVGPGYNRYGKNIAGQPGFRGDGFGSDWGVSGLTGFRIMLTNWLAARFDGTLDYIPSPNNGKAALVAQGTGLEASTIPTKNTNLGFQAGLSLMLGMCNRSKDGTTISPTSANIQTGGSASFSATATNCGRPDEVVYTVSGPGTIDATGHYTAAGPGTATITACGKKNKLCSTATVTVTAPPPPPPPRTLTRCELNPSTASPRIDQPVAYTVTLYYSDGTTETLNNPTLVAAGGSISGTSVSWSTSGAKTVTVTCGTGVTATATVDVQQFHIVVRDSAYFQFDKTVIYRQEDQAQLNAIAKVLIDHPDIRLVIDGHADADGSVKYNERLAMNRAISLKNYLGKQGAPVDRMTIILRTFGECVPVEPNNTDAGRAMNRRAELREFGNEQPGPGNAVCPEAGRERKP
jgi:outer membrane protein OmpA-like peptidoglycan-associated protein